MTVRISSFTSLTPNKPILYDLLIENIIGKLPVVPVGAGTIPHCLQNAFQGDSFRQQTVHPILFYPNYFDPNF